jgi:hypothetical protein
MLKICNVCHCVIPKLGFCVVCKCREVVKYGWYYLSDNLELETAIYN